MAAAVDQRLQDITNYEGNDMQENDAARHGGYYAYYPAPGQIVPPPRSNGRGLAIAAVSVAGIGLMGCWIPFLNVYSFVTFPIVLALAVGALVTAKRDPRVARVLAIVSVGIAVLSMVVAWSVNSWAVDTWNNSPGSPKSLRESTAATDFEVRVIDRNDLPDDGIFPA